MFRRFLLLLLIALLAAVANAQSSSDKTNEYRVTLVDSRPLNNRISLFTYFGYINSPDKTTRSLYISPPGIIYRPNKSWEFWLGMFAILNNNTGGSNTFEARPLIGAKYYIPNNKKVHLFNFTRYEYRLIYHDSYTESIPRIRDRLGAEFPLRQDNAWKPGSYYGLADAEGFYRLDDHFLQTVRVRAGIAYILNEDWRFEFIYHAEFTGTADNSPHYSGNIFRLNIKLSLPQNGIRDHL